MLDNYFIICHLLIIVLRIILFEKNIFKHTIGVSHSLVQDQALCYVIILIFCIGYRQMTRLDKS